MVDATDDVGAHFDARAHAYARGAPWVNDPASLEPVARLFADKGLRRALEVGVGSGAVPSFLHARGLLPECYVGLDLSNGMLKNAEHWAPVQGNAKRLPFPAGSVNVVVVRQAFHYFDRPSEVLAELARVLDSAGALVIAQLTPFDSDADVDWWKRAVELRQPLRRHAWTAPQLEAVMVSSGLVVHATAPIFGCSSLRGWLARYPVDEAAATELARHYEQAPDEVRELRRIKRQADGDVHFTIRWSILVGRHHDARSTR